MTSAIWLIVEDKTDVEVAKALLTAKQMQVQIKSLTPTGQRGGISRLANQLERLIAQAKASKLPGDCIAVLHDADELTQPDRTQYRRIAEVCTKFSKDVVLIIARDEIESWMLADEGLCKWLGEKAMNRDGDPRPSESLKRLVNKKTKKPYSGPIRAKVLAQLDGTGDRYSPSLREALSHITGTKS